MRSRTSRFNYRLAQPNGRMGPVRGGATAISGAVVRASTTFPPTRKTEALPRPAPHCSAPLADPVANLGVKQPFHQGPLVPGAPCSRRPRTEIFMPRQRLPLSLDDARNCLPSARDPPPGHAPLPTADQRQGGALHPHPAGQLGLRGDLPRELRALQRPLNGWLSRYNHERSQVPACGVGDRR